MNEQILTNAQLVLRDEVVQGTLVVRDGKIAEISQGKSQLAQADDLGGDFLLPGLVELHTDNQEKYFSPRPKVDWPGHLAMSTHDAQLVAAGITTSFDSVALGDVAGDSIRVEKLDAMIKAIVDSEKNGINRADHLLHLRCEVSYPGLMAFFERYIDVDLVKLVSLMDHAPGQRQFPPENIPKYREYYQGKYGFSDTEIDAFIVEQQANSAKYSDRYRRTICAVCNERGIATASHDDATIEHAKESAELGMQVAEFTTTMEAAKASHDLGLKVLMGAPNVVRGGSHSGNIAAKDLAQAGVLDILSSDYYPSALLQAAFMVAAQDNGYSLADAVALVTANPATASNLFDRGELKAGLRADLVQVRQHEVMPLIQRVWNQGKRVF
ncbi:alpha-D-ribose 1-methylphosphonate 5-triphosphate diphosphatase [Oceanospirillum sediminis]|uniref:Alpha-D-ribose 1-methylphosphonate 5-triphosphate diphosphatase n=1 Tax=Oceanospirillum sediminis TaxID=2760088 RepID=A0A839IYY4_9GAMM|nr:alpha-D-ribose 1-methylphosphonate 5-triphosphate diphosphatase [Oceanospirillum sediminis]MBB1489577.1 alpha-D-ribose 1-methylphosphonate 5-triphosphate diphosphatase [Oceanospirillum sediminis]